MVLGATAPGRSVVGLGNQLSGRRMVPSAAWTICDRTGLWGIRKFLGGLSAGEGSTLCHCATRVGRADRDELSPHIS